MPASRAGLLAALALAALAAAAPQYAAGADVTSVALGGTTMLELDNTSAVDVTALRLWLGDGTFTGFKAEEGWSAERTPQGVVVFSSSGGIGPGESAKFGVKSDVSMPGINWRALGAGGAQLGTGKVFPGDLAGGSIAPPPVVPPVQPQVPAAPAAQEAPDPPEEVPAMTADSSFRIVPDKPSVGSDIRVAGERFGPSEDLDFYIGSRMVGSFVTGTDGTFMTTVTVPADQPAARADFAVRSADGQEKTMSLNIAEPKQRAPQPNGVQLSVKGIPPVIHRGDMLEISGTGQPGGAVTGKVTSPSGEIINSRTAQIDGAGSWALEPLTVPLDISLGEYSATITDGREEVVKRWTVESGKVIIISPGREKYQPGDVMTFNGTAHAGTPVEFVVEDPLGKEVYFDIIEPDSTGFVEFAFPTSRTAVEGTYELVATQGAEKEFIFAGLGQLPTIPVDVKFDKLNYRASETALMSLIGGASEVVNLLIIDPSDKPLTNGTSITLQPDGRFTHLLDLTGYGSGVYTAVVSRGTDKTAEIFAVGLRVGSGDIAANSTKERYHPGDSVLILGSANPNSLLTMTFSDPDGHAVRIKDAITSKEGKFSDSSFRIPSGAKAGTWTINISSGSNFKNIELNVLGTAADEMTVAAVESEVNGQDRIVNVHITGAAQSTFIDIIADDGEVIVEDLRATIGGQGDGVTPWKIPKDLERGTYTIKASDTFKSANTTFTVG